MFVMVVGLICSSQLLAQDIQSELVGYWNFSEGTGSIAYDSAGTNNGNLIGSPLWIAGLEDLDYAIELDGEDDYVDCGYDSAFDIISEITLAAWIKLNAFNIEWQGLITKGDTSWKLVRDSSMEHLAFHCKGLTTGSPNYGGIGVEGTIKVTDGEWHHVAAVYDGSNVYLYVDGSEDKSEDASGEIATNEAPLYIGENSEKEGRKWNGSVDEVRIYERGLNAEDIGALYTFRNEPNEPEDWFKRGDSNADNSINITDGVYIVHHLFRGGPPPPCQDSADTNDDGQLNITDTIYVLNWLFLGGFEPPAPGPHDCGPDPTQDNLACEYYEHCEPPPLPPPPPPPETDEDEDYELELDAPDAIVGDPGNLEQAPLTLWLKPKDDVEGWSLGLAASSTDDCSIADATEGEMVGNQAEFIHVEQTDGNEGVVTAGLMEVNEPYDPFNTLDPCQSHALLEVVIEVPIPEEGTEMVIVQVVDGLEGSGEPVESVVVVGGTSIKPKKGRVKIPVCGKNADIYSDLLAYFKFSEGYGSIADDSSGYGHHGTLVGNPTWVNSARGLGGAIELDGTWDFVDCNNDSVFEFTSAFTLAAWIKVDTFDVDWQSILTKGDTSWRLMRDYISNQLAFHCTGLTTSSPNFGGVGVEGNANVNDGQWHHVAAVYDKTSVILYVDGVEDNSEDASGTPATNSEPVYIGGNSEKPGREWRGMVDEVRIYKRALNVANIAELYNFRSDGFLVAHYALDEGAGAVAHDSAGSHHGSLNGDPNWQPYGGQIGGALLLDGYSDYVNCGNDPDFDIVEEITVSAWIKITAFDKKYHAIVAKGDTSWKLERDNILKVLNFACTGLSGNWQVSSSTNIKDGQWHHVAGVYDGTKMALYVDGALDVSGGAWGLIATNSQPVYIGENPEQTDREWNGSIDDVRIYNYALSLDDIESLVCVEPVESDLDGNCRNDFRDIAIFSDEWLKCGFPWQQLCGE